MPASHVPAAKQGCPAPAHTGLRGRNREKHLHTHPCSRLRFGGDCRRVSQIKASALLVLTFPRQHHAWLAAPAPVLQRRVRKERAAWGRAFFFFFLFSFNCSLSSLKQRIYWLVLPPQLLKTSAFLFHGKNNPRGRGKYLRNEPSGQF